MRLLVRAVALLLGLAIVIGSPVPAQAGRGGGGGSRGSSSRSSSYRPSYSHAPAYRPSSSRAPSRVAAPAWGKQPQRHPTAPPAPPSAAEQAAFKQARAAKQDAAADKRSERVQAARKHLAENYYRQAGMPEGSIRSHVEGIDLTKPVGVTSLKKGTPVQQYQVPNGRQGSYYAKPSTPAETLGINPRGDLRDASGKTVAVVPNAASPYVVNKETRVLRSTAAPVVDQHSVRGEDYHAGGGGTQYHAPDKSRITPAPNRK